jgi:hypothetical protein
MIVCLSDSVWGKNTFRHDLHFLGGFFLLGHWFSVSLKFM